MMSTGRDTSSDTWGCCDEIPGDSCRGRVAVATLAASGVPWYSAFAWLLSFAGATRACEPFRGVSDHTI
jgi:hypothetical protein